MRENGYYWVRDFSGDWIIAEWYEDGWRKFGNSDFFVGDTHFKEIGKRVECPRDAVIKNDEWTCVCGYVNSLRYHDEFGNSRFSPCARCGALHPDAWFK